MTVGCILGNSFPSVCNFFAREKRGRSIGGGKPFKSFEIVDLVVVLEDERGSSILVDLKVSQ